MVLLSTVLYRSQLHIQAYNQKYLEHQEKSRTSAEGKFKGGLVDQNEQTARLHTATHLLNAALRQVLGDGVYQRGSNITPERLRFDFSFGRKLTEDELASVSQIVNEAIKKEIPVNCIEMTVGGRVNNWSDTDVITCAFKL